MNELILHSIIKCKCMCISNVLNFERNALRCRFPFDGNDDEEVAKRYEASMHAKVENNMFYYQLTMGAKVACVVGASERAHWMRPAAIWTINHYAILQWAIGPILSLANYMAITTMI